MLIHPIIILTSIKAKLSFEYFITNIEKIIWCQPVREQKPDHHIKKNPQNKYTDWNILQKGAQRLG